MYAVTTAIKKIVALKSRLRVVQGSSSAGKTIGIILHLINLAQQDKSPTLTSIVSESFPHLKRGAMRDFMNIMQEHGYYKDALWNKTDSTYTFETGSKIEFFSADQSDKVRGARRDRLFINEADNISFETFEQLEIRTKEFVFIDYNPAFEYWLFTEIKPHRKDLDFIILTYKDNEALAPSIRLSIESRRHRKNWFKVYGEGLLAEAEGRIFSNWQILDEVPHEARLERYGIDFGYSIDSSSVVALYYYNGGYVLDEILHETGLSNRDIANTLKNLPRALIIADSAEPKSIAEIKSYGLSILPTVKGKDSVSHGIHLMQDQKISITKQSTNGIKSYRNYMWKTDKDGKILNEPDHYLSDFCDASRYAFSSLIPAIQRREYVASMPTRQARVKANPAV